MTAAVLRRDCWLAVVCYEISASRHDTASHRVRVEARGSEDAETLHDGAKSEVVGTCRRGVRERRRAPEPDNGIDRASRLLAKTREDERQPAIHVERRAGENGRLEALEQNRVYAVELCASDLFLKHIRTKAVRSAEAFSTPS